MSGYKKVLAVMLSLAMVIGLMPMSQLFSVSGETTTTRYEAEAGDISGAKGINSSVSNASGKKAVTCRPTQYVTITVNVKKAGTYKIPVRYATGNNINWGVVPVEITVNESDSVSYDFENTGNDTTKNGYNTFSTKEIEVSLKAGENTITLKNAGEGDTTTTTMFVNFDYIEISEGENETTTAVTTTTEAVTEDSSLYPLAEGRFEAENAISFTKGSASSDYTVSENENYSGGKAIGGMNTWPNDGRAYCTTKVNATKAGTYNMTIGYAGGEADHPCTIDVRTNDGEWISTQAPVTAWNVVGTITLQVELKEGVNTIDVTGACNVWYSGMSWEWINLDYFELSKAAEEATTEPETSYKPTQAVGTVEAEDAEFISGTISSNPSFSNGKYVEGMNSNVNGNMSNAKYLSYRVNATEGNYKMHIAYSTTSEDTKFGIQTNDDEWQIIHVQTTGGWATLGNRDVVVHLKDGENTIKITGSVDSGWIILDKMEMENTTEEMTKDPQEIPENDEPGVGEVKKTGVQLQQENLVSYRGRNMTNENSITFDYSGSGFEFNYNGKGTIKANITTTATEKFAIDVDGTVTYVSHNSKTGSIILAKDLSEGNHTIKLYKTKEAMTGLAQLNYMIYDENAVLSPMTYSYKFLTIGASSTCGSQMDPDTGNQNGYLAFPSVVSRAYNATWQQISVSGRGCTQGTLGESGWAFSQEHQLADLFTYQSWFRDKEQKFDTSSYVPDVIITNFNNDFGKDTVKKGYSVDEVFEHMMAFISELRATYPNAYIVMTYGNYPSYVEDSSDSSKQVYNNYTIIEEYKKNVEKYKASSGDEKLAFVTFPDLVNGQSGHPSEEEHKYLSELVSAQISKFLNVENPLPQTHFEAEDGTIHGTLGKKVQITTWASKFSNNSYIEGLNTNLNGSEPSDDGSNVSYVSVPVTAWKTGNYKIKLVTSAKDGTESYIRVNGGKWTKFTVTDTGDWAKVAINEAVTAKLNKGANTVDVMGTTNGGYGCVDRVDISYDSDIVPETTTPAQVETPDKEETTTPTQVESSSKEESTHSQVETKTTVKKLGTTSVKKTTKKLSAKKLSVTFKRVNGAKKYQVQISTSKKFKKVIIRKTVKKASVNKKTGMITALITDKKLKNKKKLYIRIKAVGATKWSKAKKVKVKK